MTWHSMGYVARHYGVSVSTIRRREAKGIIPKSIRTLGGHRRFQLHVPASSDLQRQIRRLKDPGCEEVLSDIGSGLNCAKPGLRRLLGALLDGRVGKLTVVHEDRLLRFGVGLVKFICDRMKTEFVVV